MRRLYTKLSLFAERLNFLHKERFSGVIIRRKRLESRLHRKVAEQKAHGRLSEYTKSNSASMEQKQRRRQQNQKQKRDSVY